MNIEKLEEGLALLKKLRKLEAELHNIKGISNQADLSWAIQDCVIQISDDEATRIRDARISELVSTIGAVSSELSDL